MRPIYNGIEYNSYSGIQINLSLLDKFEAKINSLLQQNVNINHILEIYNIEKILHNTVDPNDNSKLLNIKISKLQKICKKQIGCFFHNIIDDNFEKIEKEVSADYYDDFWEAFNNFQGFKNVSNQVFKSYLENTDRALSFILKHKNIVNYYGKELKDILLISSQTINFIKYKFLNKNKRNYYLPQELSSDDIKNIIIKYTESKDPNPNTLELILYAPKISECPIDNKTKLVAKKKIQQFYDLNNSNKSEHWIKVQFKEQEEISKLSKGNGNYTFSFDSKWLEEHLDFPTILNNFIYVFNFFDFSCRSNIISRKNDTSALESILQNNGIKFYEKNHVFQFQSIFSTICLNMYYDFLNRNKIDIEVVFKWFFENYLKKEFSIDRFFFNNSSNEATFLEKCKNLSSEIERVLTQYHFYVQDSKINHELIELSPIEKDIFNCPGLLDKKYIYPKSNIIKNIMSLMFSDQTSLAYIGNDLENHSSFFETILNERIYINNLSDHQSSCVKFLEKKNVVHITPDGLIAPSLPESFVLRDLFNKDVSCFNYFNLEQKQVIKKLAENGDIEIQNTLFSIPEQKYLSYILNDKKYTNGLEIRNKYLHGRYPLDENSHYTDYLILLNVMILIIVKINEEVLWKYSTF